MKKHLTDAFVPSAENDYTPAVLQQVAMGAMATMVFLTFTIANFQSLLWWSSDWLVGTVLPAVIVELTNEERADDALGQLRRNATLDAAAQLKAENMAKEGYFAHFSPSGVSPWHWFGQVDYPFVHAGENLAVHFTDSGEVVEAWMNSPTHRANIMNGNFAEIGVGTAKGTFEGYETVFVVQMFGTPALASVPEPIPVVNIDPIPVLAAEGDSVPTTTSELALVSLDDVTAPTTIPELALVDVIEAPATSPIVSGASDSLALEEKIASTTPDIPVEIVEIVTQDDRVVFVSDTVSTSTALVPATIAPDTTGGNNSPSILAKAATQPQLWLQYLYSAMAVFVLLALLISIFIEIKHQRPMQVAYASLLLLLMGGLYYVHASFTAGALII